MSKELKDELILMGKNARKASRTLALATSDIKNNALEAMADDIEKNKEKRFKDNLKSKSFFYDSLRKIKHKYYTKKKSIFSDLDQSYPPPKEISLKKYDYLNFKDAYKNKVKIEKLLIQNKKVIGIKCKNITIYADSIVLTSGTFLSKFPSPIEVEANIRLFIDLKNLEENRIAIEIETNNRTLTTIM